MGFWVMCSSNVFKTEGSPEVTFWSFHCFNRSRRWWRKGLNDGIKKAHHATFPFDWKKKKKPPKTLFYFLGDRELWAERNKGTTQETRLALLAPRGSDTSFSRLPFFPLPSCYAVMRNKISPVSRCVGSGAFTLLDCLFYVSSLALRRDWKAPAPGALDLLLMNAAFIT